MQEVELKPLVDLMGREGVDVVSGTIGIIEGFSVDLYGSAWVQLCTPNPQTGGHETRWLQLSRMCAVPDKKMEPAAKYVWSSGDTPA